MAPGPLEKIPGLRLSVSIDSVEDLASLTSRGLKMENILAWTGIEEPNPGLTEELGARSVEVIFGTLGGQESYDRQYEMADTDEEYAALSELGIELIATDRPEAASRAIKAAGRLADPAACSLED